MVSTYVQYGCGFSAPKEWLNFDSSPTLRYERIPFIGKLYTKNEKRFPSNVKYGDIIIGLPGVPNDSCNGVYCSHVLEHMNVAQMRKALTNTYSILKPGGIFRLVVPDLYARMKVYFDLYDKNHSEANSIFMESLNLNITDKTLSFSHFLYSYFRNSHHLHMWDEISMKKELESVGFKNVRRCTFNDCEDPMFKLCEDFGRFCVEIESNKFDELAIECKK